MWKDNRNEKQAIRSENLAKEIIAKSKRKIIRILIFLSPKNIAVV